MKLQKKFPLRGKPFPLGRGGGEEAAKENLFPWGEGEGSCLGKPFPLGREEEAAKENLFLWGEGRGSCY
jgi:hypothetical protein